MIPSALAILIYQILAILGVEAVSQIVTSIAYKKRDLDFKLMYKQGPIDLLLNYNKFDQKTHQKAVVILFACLSIALKFIPTIFTKISSADIIYYDTTVTALDKAQATTQYNWPSTMPVFDDFVSYVAPPNNVSLSDMLSRYMTEKLHQNITQNSQGYWFEPQPNIKPFAWDARQRADFFGFTAYNGEGRTAASTYDAFGFRHNDRGMGISISVGDCNNLWPNNFHDNMTSTLGLDVYGVENYASVCYPIYDTSLHILLSNVFPNDNVSSALNANDTIFRQMKLPQGTSASSSFGVSIFNHNSTHMTMGVKKSAHITLYSFDHTIIPPSNCSSAAGKPDFSNNFIDLSYDAVLCDLLTRLNNATLELVILQAVGRRWTDNYVINTVYTLQRGNEFEKGDSVMIDYTMLQTFTVEGNLQEHKEHMVAYQSKSLQLNESPDGPIAIDLTNDKIGSLLKELDPSYMDQASIEFLVSMATLKVRYENGDFSDFNLYQAQVLDAVRTPVWWIITVAALALVFIMPQASRLVSRRIPEYSKDLRSLLLLTIERAHVFGESIDVKNVSIILNELDNEADRVALLAVNGYPVAVGQKASSSDSRLLDETMDASGEQLVDKS